MSSRRLFLPLLLILLFAGACSHAPNAPVSKRFFGLASHYGPEWDGRQTASGERFDNSKLTAAHKTLPFGTRVRVTLLSTQKSVVVRINDRGPFVRGRIIDLSDEAARRIGLDRHGVAEVLVEVLGKGGKKRSKKKEGEKLEKKEKADQRAAIRRSVKEAEGSGLL